MSWSNLTVLEWHEPKPGTEEPDVKRVDASNDSPALADYINKQTQHGSTFKGRLIIIEVAPDKPTCEPNGLPNRDPHHSIDSLMAQLSPDSPRPPEKFYEEHLKITLRFSYSKEKRFHTLVTSLDPSKAFHLDYSDPRCVTTKQSLFHGHDGASNAKCPVTGREIHCHELSRNEALLIISRKVSFWSVVDESDPSKWDAVMLCDPRTKDIITMSGRIHNVQTSVPYEGGYHFIIGSNRYDYPDNPKQHASPFEELEYYYRNYIKQLNPSTAADATLFAKKMVAGKFHLLLSHLDNQVDVMMHQGWTEEEISEIAVVRREWSRFHSVVFIDALNTNLDALGIRRADPDPSQYVADWRAVNAEFQQLLISFQQCRGDYDRLTAQLVALNGMTENERSVRISKVTAWLASILTPPALIASFLSMSDLYLPGGSRQHIYWIIMGTGIIGIGLGYSLYQMAIRYQQGRLSFPFVSRHRSRSWQKFRKDEENQQ